MTKISPFINKQIFIITFKPDKLGQGLFFIVKCLTLVILCLDEFDLRLPSLPGLLVDVSLSLDVLCILGRENELGRLVVNRKKSIQGHENDKPHR